LYIAENSDTRPQHNLAFEEYLCLRALRDGEGVFMLWRNEPSIIVGRFQNTLEEIDSDFVREHGIHVVRRNSGGGAVYHDLGNVNYSFISLDDGERGNEKFGDFAAFTEPVITALASMGVRAEMSGRNDLAACGKKISGGAQFRRSDPASGRSVTMHHGTLLFDADLDVLSRALRPPKEKFESKAVKSVRGRVGNIISLLPSPIAVEEFMASLSGSVRTRLGLVPLAIDEAGRAEVGKLQSEKYSSWEWNYGSSPRFTERKRARFPWGSIEAFLVVDGGKITDCSFRGDFFSPDGDAGISKMRSRLLGRSYSGHDMADALSGLDAGSVFAGSNADDLLMLLSPGSQA
jgi:lipoate-protein ligase A